MPLFLATPSSGAGSGSVTSVGLSTPGLLDTVSGSPVTSAGTLALALKTQAANKVLAGPASGADAVPTLRALVAADLPAATTSAQGGIQLATTLGVPDTTAGAAGSSGKAADANHSHLTSSGLWLPADHGLLAWNADPFLTSTNASVGTAVVYLIRLKIPQAISVTNVLVGVSVVGNTLTNSYLGLYDSTGAIIGTSATQNTAFTGLGLITAALVGGPFPVAAGATVYAAVQVGSASTAPKLACYNSGGANQPGVINANVTGASGRVIGIASGNAALPSPITLSSCSTQVFTFWCALS